MPIDNNEQNGRSVEGNPENKERTDGAGAVLPNAASAVMRGASGGGGIFQTVFGGGVQALLASKFGVAALSLGLGAAGMAGIHAVKNNPAQKTAPAQAALERPAARVHAVKRDAQGSKSLSYMQQSSNGDIRWEGGAGSAGASGADGNGEESNAGADYEAGDAAGNAAASGNGALGKEQIAVMKEAAEDAVSKKEDQPRLVASAPGGSGAGAMSGGSGVSAGAAVSQAMGNLPPAQKGASREMSGNRRAKIVAASGQRGGKGGSSLRGATARRLSGMSRKLATASGSDTAVADAHNREWDGARPGGRAISGAGTGSSQGGISSDEGGSAGRPLAPASSYGKGYEDGRDDARYNRGGHGVGAAGNLTPYQQMVDMAQAMLMLASVMLFLSGLLGLFAKISAKTIGGLPLAAKLYKMAKYVAWIAMGAAGIVTMLGIGIMMSGQANQGAIFTGVGAVLTILSYISADNYEKASSASTQAHDTATKAFEGNKDALTNKLGTDGADASKFDLGEIKTEEFAKLNGKDLGMSGDAMKGFDSSMGKFNGSMKGVNGTDFSNVGNMVGGGAGAVTSQNYGDAEDPNYR